MAIRDYLQRHILIVGIFITVVGLVTASDALHDRTAEIVIWTEGFISRAPLIGMLLFVLLAMLSAMVAFFSSAIFAPIAIYAWGKGGALVLLWLGWLLGGILTYCVGRYLGRSFAAMIVDEEKIDGWERELGKRARFVHILMFQAVVPSEVPGYVLGILRYSFPLYLAALSITELPYAIATVYLGESFLEGESVVFIVLGLAVIVIAKFLFQGIRNFLKQNP